MDRVLGLSMTPAAVRWVLVEGANGEGATIDHDVLDIGIVRAASSATAQDLVEQVFGSAVYDGRLSGIGVTWTPEVAVEASVVLEALAAEGFLDAVPVWEEEAATALAAGVKDLANFDDIALCIVEAESALVVATTAQDALVDRLDRAYAGDPRALAQAVIARLDMDDWTPEIIYTVGSADDLDVVAAILRDATAIPVISAAEAGLALARGAALASARTSGMEAWDALPTTRDAFAVDFAHKARSRSPRMSSKSVALTSVLVAAALTFVVSLSIALSLRMIPGTDSDDGQQTLDADQTAIAAPAAKAPAPAARPSVPHAPPPSPAAAPPAPRAVVVAQAPADEPPEAVTEDPAEASGPLEAAPEEAPEVPAGVYVPPPADYVPPSAAPPLPGFDEPAPQPRLRDRIIERIPIINRFHEPEYPQP